MQNVNTKGNNNMKLSLLAVPLLILAGCGKNKESKLTLEEKILGQWHSTSLSVSGDVYLQFDDENGYGNS